jgi:acetyl-CoA C-acetyltransferase
VRAVRAIDQGRLQEEIFPVEVTSRDGTVKKFDTDEHPRRDSTAEKMASLKVLHPEIEGFGITAGNSSGLNDAACALVLVDGEYARTHGVQPLAKILSWASVGLPPRDTGSGPIHAIPKALRRAGLTVHDVDLIEINEAFASVPVAACRELGLDEEITNVNGSGCSLGHPVGATGARMIVTTMFELARRGGGIGVASMCAGGGMGSATVFEVFPG